MRGLRGRGETVGIVAVDPSSARSGGALLGDRARVRSGAQDPGVFIRSMAARTRLGGLADATFPSLAVLAAVFDRVFVETVGVGQSERDVAELVDTLLYVAQPGAGDALQFMKAGILEDPDVFAVNKADQGAPASRTAAELEASLGLAARRDDDWKPPVLQISARDNRGIDALIDTLDAHRAHLVKRKALTARRLRSRVVYTLDTLEKRYGSFGVQRVGGRLALAERVRAQPGTSGFAWVLSLGREIEDALSGSA